MTRVRTAGSLIMSASMSKEPPAENPRPAPWTMTARTRSSLSITGQMSAICSCPSAVTAFRFGPSKTIRRIASSTRSTRKAVKRS
jgi:hypothetical protein